MKAMSQRTPTNSRPTQRRLASRLLLTLGILAGALSCRNVPETSSTDGETHFLRSCDTECGGDQSLACLCGVCTLPCTETSACGSLAWSAECVSTVERTTSSACPEARAAAFCDVPCNTDESCSRLSPSHRCLDGFCRASADSGGSDAGTAADRASAAICYADHLVGNEVLVIGDLFIAQGHQVTAYLEEMAREAGSLPVGQRFRDNSSATDNALARNGHFLAEQYARGKADGAIKVVVMDGGAADLLFSACDSPATADCQAIIDAVAAANELLSQMAQDGVEHIIWFFNPDPTDSTYRARLDVLRPLLQATCESSTAPCDWIDLRPTFEGHYDEYMQTDGIPTAAGAEATASAVWTAMQRGCFAR